MATFQRPIGNFLDLFSEMKNSAEKNRGEWKFERDVKKGPSVGVFQVSYPVLIVHGGVRDCFTALVYAPIAFSSEIKQCSQLLK